VLSWNINELSGLKKDDPECVQFPTFTVSPSIEMPEDVVVVWLCIIVKI